MALHLFRRLMPAQADFTELFCRQAEAILAAAEALRRLVETPERTEEIVAAIRRIETEADAAAREVFVAANRTFYSPIDREDILRLGHDLDDVVDLIEDLAKAIQLFRLQEFPREVHFMVDAALRCAAAIEKAVPLLGEIGRQHRKIFSLCEEINRIEGEADDCFDAGLSSLHKQVRAGAIETLDYIDQKQVYELLEALVDKCDDVGDALETITTKHV